MWEEKDYVIMEETSRKLKFNDNSSAANRDKILLDSLQSLKQFFIYVSYHILVDSLTLMALFKSP